MQSWQHSRANVTGFERFLLILILVVGLLHIELNSIYHENQYATTLYPINAF